MAAKWKKPVLVGSAMALALACAACAPKANDGDLTGGKSGGEPAAGAVVQTSDKSWEQWQGEYPLQVGSFFDGLDEVESWDGKVHSHSMLYKNVPAMANGVDKFGTACMACKSTTGTDLYNEMGLDAFSQPWEQYGDSVDWWDCGLCHVDGTPGGELHYNGMAATAFGGTLLDGLPQEQAVCGQCHNFYGAVYTRGGLMQKMQDGEVDPKGVDPYRYGTDPDSLMKAALEDGYVMNVDEKTGIASFQANHPEVEVFQGSVHESLGMACIDCHMPTKTSEGGEAFTSHNASSSPLENPEALEYCLTCHKAQGIESADQMIEFVHAAQQEAADLEAAFAEKQTQLKSLIADAAASGVINEATLQQARDIFTRATWYVRYADGGGDFKGQKVAHNPEDIVSYIERATVMMDEAIALFA
ncbi:ammonia-forming cytochrome c nitrite reductase subunit c552 [Arabiibacter massiliensis]|uniref:ammonia-forming cytochrome c nitrite reductase subunit c552 n=1 Tax=Arabiibacter massiliensis TaxID=1870985 RepID=UPI00155ADD2F|nr:ammonia-forming cytochrome c nitrite reductase subunit c552 [Arabiibacter massiliensis]